MERKWKITAVIVTVSFLIIACIFGGLLYFAIDQMQFGINGIEIDEIEQHGFSVDVDMRINASISSPILDISGDGGTFNVKIGDVDIGNGEFGSFKATFEESDIITNFNATIGIDLALPLLNYLLGNDLIITITILAIKINGISVPINYILTETIPAIEDL
ncbi:MAG: hypothetical protein ACTSWY_13370 [Promethearchaeota archaeon]